MEEIVESLSFMYGLVAMAMILTLVAMGIDLAFGWKKAKERGDAHTSYAFSRSISKFLYYEGSIIVGSFVDAMLYYGVPKFGLMERYDVPLFAFFIAIVLCCTEIWSMREKADEKTRNRVNEVVTTIVKGIGKDELARMLAEHLKKEEE